jgi:8-oxo-dGTP diphosphatase
LEEWQSGRMHRFRKAAGAQVPREFESLLFRQGMEDLRKRATAIIIKDGKILLMRRIKPGFDYYIFPGGGVDGDETPEQAMVREVREELSLEVTKYEFLFSFKNIPVPEMITIHKGNRDEYLFNVIEYTGTPELGGEEKEKMSEENQYHLEWVSLKNLEKMKNVHSQLTIKRVLDYYSGQK